MEGRRKKVIIICILAAVLIIAIVAAVKLVMQNSNETNDFFPFESDDIIIVENQSGGLVYFEQNNIYYSVDKTNHTLRSLTDEEYEELASEILNEREKSDLETEKIISGLDIDLVRETNYWKYALLGNCIYIAPPAYSPEEYYMYKYDIAADSAERIELNEDLDNFRGFDFLVAENRYPDISGCADEIIENFDFCNKKNVGKGFVYLDGERIFFQLYNKKIGKDK
nr:hypothetical protein [Oscillospiraceae bacterium]